MEEVRQAEELETLRQEIEELRREMKRLRREKTHIEEKSLNAERVMLSRNLAIETFQTKLKSLVKERTRQLEEQVAIAQSASTAKSDFLARMSHEIRTPLNAIIGMSDLMRTDNFDENQSRYFSDMRSMAQSLLAIINDILDFSKIEAGALTLEPVHYNLRFLFENIVSMCRFLAEGKELLFTSSFAPDLANVVFGDETRVRQILVNLINNAIKYTQKGSVDFSLSHEEREGKQYIMGVIKDTGRGIKKDDQERLFRKFTQFDREQNRGIVGTGLGLSIAKQLIDMMGGFIEVESEYGKGSMFTVCLPLEPGDPAKVAPASGSETPVMACDNVRALVVDDMRVNLTVALGLLARHNIHADAASSGQEALQKAAALYAVGQKYDIIFMDHMMPGMDGLETTERYRLWEESTGQQGATPIIAFSANAVQGAHELFIGAGMNDFLSKPVNASAMNRVLIMWLPREKTSLNTEAALLQAKKEAPQFASREQIKSELPALGINVKTALETFGNEDALLAALQSFAEDSLARLEAMQAAAAAKDWKRCAAWSREFTSAFTLIGNEDMAVLAASVDAACQIGHNEACAVKIKVMVSEAADFCQRLRAFLER